MDSDVSRRRVLAAGGTLVAAGLVGTGGTGSATAQSADAPTLTRVARGFTSPLGFEHPPAGDPVVVDQAGRLYALGDGVRVFLDVRDRMVDVSGYSEAGLLGLAFHPNYAENGRAFVRYSAPSDTAAHTFVLAEFTATEDRTRLDPDSERRLLTVPQPQSNHNAGAVAFGPDGFLYVGTGDGGGAGDRGSGHVEDWYDANAGGNGQDVTENLLGSVLRIDVDGEEGGKPYAIPDDNPLVGREGLDEHYAWGLRNPWRFSFDGEGRLFVADVGQNKFEEVSLVEKGDNYGWNVREADACYRADPCPTETPDGDPLIDPILAYDHSLGQAVIGGYVYPRDDLPGIDAGDYVFGDWSGSFGQGAGLFVGREGDDGWTLDTVGVDGLPGERYLLAFGQDARGRLYLCTSGRSTVGGETGEVYRLTASDSDGGGGDGSGGDGGDGGTTTVRTTTETRDASGLDGDSDSDGQPGFGVLAALGGLGLGLGLARRRGR